jgi:hypothetical protein
MVFPGTADPLQGYQQGGPVKASMGMVVDKSGKLIGYDSGPAVVDEQGNYMGGGGLGTPGFMPLPGIDMQGKPIEGYTPPPPRTGPPDLRQQFEVDKRMPQGSFTNDMMGVGIPAMQNPRGTKEYVPPAGVTVAGGTAQDQQIEEYAQDLLRRSSIGRGLSPQDALIEARKEAQKVFTQQATQQFPDFTGAPTTHNDMRIPDNYIGIPPFGNRRDPLPDTGNPIEQKTSLNTAQANLATAEKELSNLQQQLATIPLEDEAKRNAIVEQINQQQPKITAAKSALASASQQFQTVAVPTAAEAVGSTVTTPQDVITRQPVDKIVEDAGQTITAGTGKLTGEISPTTTTGITATAEGVGVSPAALSDVTTTVKDVRAYTPQERFGTISQDAVIKAQQIATEDLNVRDVEAAQGTGQQIISPSKRALQQGELVSGAANAEQSAQFLEGIEAATGAPSSAATVQGQLTNLMSDFEGGKPPPWAAGAMRQATAIMAQRGLAASSMAGQAIVQAAMESALPIAMQDAQTVASFEAQNLSNRQQRAMLAAQQRATFLGMEFDQTFQARVQNASKISDIANLNFSAEQQIALENAQLAQTMDLANLSNKQAVVMTQAATIAQADLANLNNRQQAAVQNAQNFLQMDFRNLDITQQNDMFKSQSVIQSLFTDASAQNASSQFNATSQNQTNQFFANLKTQVGQFNSSQTNAMTQYNVGQTNALEQFKQQVKNQREQFNAQNALVIAQANAQWRQQLATVNNASLNDANRQNALQANGLTQKGLDEIWQKERDLMAYAFATAESAAERRNKLLLQELDAEGKSDSAFSSALGTLGGAIINGVFGLF